jgi:uncharacterized membrane protein
MVKIMNEQIKSPRVVRFFYIVAGLNLILPIIGINVLVNDSQDTGGLYLIMAGIIGAISCIVFAVFFKMLNKVIFWLEKIHMKLEDKKL